MLLVFFAATKKLSIDVESPHFLTFSAKYHECKIEKRDGHGKLRNDHGKVMEKYVVKSVGTLQGCQYTCFCNSKGGGLYVQKKLISILLS